MTSSPPSRRSGSAGVVAVVGGGISGLVAARALDLAGVERVLLFEAGERLGGKVRTQRFGDLTIECGPDSFLANDGTGAGLCSEVGLGSDLVAPAAFGALVWSRGTLRHVPRGFPYGIPASPYRALRAGALSARGAVRAAGDLVLGGPLTGQDISVGSFVRRRFGSEALERLVDPLLAGTRAGEPDDMSLATALPHIDAVARRGRSVIVGLRAARRAGETREPAFLAVRGGMGRLTEAIATGYSERVEVLTGAEVQGIERRAEGGYRVHLGEDRVATGRRGADRGSADRGYPVDGLVLATPSFAASTLLRPMASELATEIGSISHASVAVATLVYPPGSCPPVRGASGVLVGSREARTISALTWFSAKWPHLAPPDGRDMIRCFIGRAGRDPTLQRDDADLVARVSDDVARILGIGPDPLENSVTRWEKGIPQYLVGHRDRMARVDSHLDHLPRLALAGAGYRGSGLPDCITQAREAAVRAVGKER